MKRKSVLTIVGLLVSMLITGHFSFSCSDDDDASLDDETGEDDDEFHSDDNNIDDDFIADDDSSPDGDDDDLIIDDDDDDDNDDNDNSPDQDCVATYEKLYECHPDGVLNKTLAECIADFCYGSTDSDYGVDGAIVQCYLAHPDNCILFITCVDHLLNETQLDEVCAAAYATFYDCRPDGFGGYTEEEMVESHCYGSEDAIYGTEGGVVQCYLAFGDNCDEYIACVYALFQ